MSDDWKREIGKHEFSDEDVRFQFATDDGVCLEFSDDESEQSLSGVLDKNDVIALGKRLSITGKDYKPLPKRPATTEYIKGSLEVTSDHITFKTLIWLGFCCLCLGVGIGANLI